MKSRFVTILFIALLITAEVWADETLQEPYPHYSLFQNFAQLWSKGNSTKIRDLFGKSVKLNLQHLPDSAATQKPYPKEKVEGILKWYFERVEVLKFKYDVKKMTPNYGVAIYQYRIKETSIVYNRRLYIYLRQVNDDENVKWVITAIHEIGFDSQQR